MFQFLISIFAFIIAISVIVAVHEFGHFWVARQFGIKVLRFSIGFGRPLYRWYDKLGTEYLLSAIPLGGYVALFGERAQTIAPAERHMAFSHQRVWIRMLVLLAGPFFNFLFATVVYWIVFSVGVSVFVPILGNVPKDSVAGLAGLHAGQEIVAIEGKPTSSWQTVSAQLFSYLGEDKRIVLTIRDNKSALLQNKTLDLGQWSDASARADWLESLGMTQLDPTPAVVGKVTPDYPGFKAGLKEKDEIIALDQHPIYSRSEFIKYIQARPNKVIVLQVLRDHQKIKLRLEPTLKQSAEGKNIGFIGVEFPALKEIPKHFLRVERFGVIEALGKALNRTFEYASLTLKVMKKMLWGEVSVRHLNGPLGMAKFAGQSATFSAVFGIKYFFEFLAVISISIGVLNLLPIPILDGGHLMYCVYEILSGRAASEMAQTVGTWIGSVILIGFMLLAFYNDILSLL